MSPRTVAVPAAGAEIMATAVIVPSASVSFARTSAMTTKPLTTDTLSLPATGYALPLPSVTLITMTPFAVAPSSSVTR